MRSTELKSSRVVGQPHYLLHHDHYHSTYHHPNIILQLWLRYVVFVWLLTTCTVLSSVTNIYNFARTFGSQRITTCKSTNYKYNIYKDIICFKCKHSTIFTKKIFHNKHLIVKLKNGKAKLEGPIRFISTKWSSKRLC